MTSSPSTGLSLSAVNGLSNVNGFSLTFKSVVNFSFDDGIRHSNCPASSGRIFLIVKIERGPSAEIVKRSLGTIN